MSDLVLTNTQNDPGVWLSPDGQEEPIVRNLYIVPPLGQYRLRILRIAKPFDMPKSDQFGGGAQRMTRLELQIIGGKGNGKKVAPMVSLSIGRRAILGQVIRAAERRELDPGEQYDLFNLIGKEFMATLRPSESVGEDGKPKYSKLVDGTIMPVQADDETWEAVS
jgi:hypothetical protein